MLQTRSIVLQRYRHENDVPELRRVLRRAGLATKCSDKAEERFRASRIRNHHLVPVPDGDGGHCASDEASPDRSDPHEKALLRDTLVHRFIQLMQLEVPSALSRRRPGSTCAVGTGFRRCSGFDMTDDASLPDESCE